jgi:hypothetical protein
MAVTLVCVIFCDMPFSVVHIHQTRSISSQYMYHNIICQFLSILNQNGAVSVSFSTYPHEYLVVLNKTEGLEGASSLLCQYNMQQYGNSQSVHNWLL